MENNQNTDKEQKVQEPSKQERGKKLSKVKIVGIVIVLLIIWFISIQIMAAETYDMVVVVKEEENVMGVNPLDIALDFGDLSRNLGASRFVALKNSSESDRYIIIWMRGEITDMVKLSNNNFVLAPNQEEKLEFGILIPPSAEPRQYKGKATVFMWPKLW